MTTYQDPTTTSTKSAVTIDARLRDYDRGVLRSAFRSLFWAIVLFKRDHDKFKLQTLADALDKDKSEVSRWFGAQPNWQLNTVADIASALNVEIEVRARDRSTGRIFAPYGVVQDVRAELVETEHKLDLDYGGRAPARVKTKQQEYSYQLTVG